MKTRILITGLAFVSAISFGQKREIKKAEKAIKSNSYNEALNYLKEAEPMLGSVDNSMKAQFYAARGQALLGSGNTDFAKMKEAAEAFAEAVALDATIEEQLASPIQSLRASLINSAVLDQNAERYDLATEKLYVSYTVSNDPSDLYYAAANSVNNKDYDSAIKYYQMLLDTGYTGESEDFVATNKETGEVEAFESENVRNIAVKSGEFIKPEKQISESKRGEILRNMTLIHIERGDSEKATSLIKEARAENPTDISLIRADADMSYKMGDIARYNKLMSEIVASDPNNPEIYFNLGVGSAEINNKEKAIEYYKKALELKPDYEAALINLAVLKLSGENKIVEEMNALGNSSAENKKYDALKQERKDLYTETLPYLEKVIKLNPNNMEVVRTLMNMYGQVGQDDKFKVMKAKFEAMESKN